MTPPHKLVCVGILSSSDIFFISALKKYPTYRTCLKFSTAKLDKLDIFNQFQSLVDLCPMPPAPQLLRHDLKHRTGRNPLRSLLQFASGRNPGNELLLFIPCPWGNDRNDPIWRLVHVFFAIWPNTETPHREGVAKVYSTELAQIWYEALWYGTCLVCQYLFEYVFRLASMACKV